MLSAIISCLVLATTQPVEVPFESYSHLIVVDGSINGEQPVKVVFDSGAPMMAVNIDRLDELGIEPISEMTGRGFSPSSRVRYATLSPMTLMIGGKTFQSQNPIATEFDTPASVFGIEADVIIGHEVLQQSTVEIDYERNVLVLHEPKEFRYQGDGAIVPITVTPTRGIVNITVTPKQGKPVKIGLTLDTGSMDSISLFRPFSGMPDLAGKEEDRFEAEGFGIGGKFGNVFGVRAQSVHICTERFDDLLIGMIPFQMDTGGILGANILHRYSVTLDYARGRMILEPSRYHREPRFVNRSGLRLTTAGDDFDQVQVAVVIGQSPAKRAGIEQGDFIESIDGVDTSTLTVEHIREKLSSSGLHVLSVNRDDVIHTIQFESSDWWLEG